MSFLFYHSFLLLKGKIFMGKTGRLRSWSILRTRHFSTLEGKLPYAIQRCPRLLPAPEAISHPAIGWSCPRLPPQRANILVNAQNSNRNSPDYRQVKFKNDIAEWLHQSENFVPWRFFFTKKTLRHEETKKIRA